MAIQNICVFCGSRPGADPAFAETARQVGPHFKRHGVGFVYGGSRVGLMGLSADSCIASGVPTIGVIPRFLEARGEISHTQLSELILVDTMHERKQIMSERADAFIALPGGIGTLEEFAEIFTWGVLGLHSKPFGLLNINGYYDHLAAFFDHLVAQKMMEPVFRSMILTDTTLDGLITQMKAYQTPIAPAAVIDKTKL
jgi:uncharacterized protein (TIGR00730 family)